MTCTSKYTKNLRICLKFVYREFVKVVLPDYKINKPYYNATKNRVKQNRLITVSMFIKVSFCKEYLFTGGRDGSTCAVDRHPTAVIWVVLSNEKIFLIAPTAITTVHLQLHKQYNSLSSQS